jgi:hypothetical protein
MHVQREVSFCEIVTLFHLPVDRPEIDSLRDGKSVDNGGLERVPFSGDAKGEDSESSSESDAKLKVVESEIIG